MRGTKGKRAIVPDSHSIAPAGERSSIVLRRGRTVESRHRVHVAVSDTGGRLLARAGDVDLVTFLRSAAKPFQALPLVEDGAVERFGIPADELALCCASHSGEPGHVEGVRRLLARAAVPEGALECGPHRPISAAATEALVRAGRDPERIHNNCSGKHAGMLALATHHGWPLEGYLSAEHPVQKRMRAEVARWSGVPAGEVEVGVDGCGVVCFALPLRAMARAFAALAAADAPVLAAMGDHPWMVAGTDRLDTRVMAATGGAVVVKTGAEGVYCGVARETATGFALKVEDGAARASEVALVSVLESLGLVGGEGAEALSPDRNPPVVNTRGEEAAFLEAEIDLQWMGGAG